MTAVVMVSRRRNPVNPMMRKPMVKRLTDSSPHQFCWEPATSGM